MFYHLGGCFSLFNTGSGKGASYRSNEGRDGVQTPVEEDVRDAHVPSGQPQGDFYKTTGPCRHYVINLLVVLIHNVNQPYFSITFWNTVAFPENPTCLPFIRKEINTLPAVRHPPDIEYYIHRDTYVLYTLYTCLKKYLNASRPSEHPPVRGKNIKKCNQTLGPLERRQPFLQIFNDRSNNI